MYRFNSRKFSLLKETTIILIFLIILKSILYFNTTQDPVEETTEKLSSEYECHYLESGDALPPIEALKYSPYRHSIFFHETSCGGNLTKRQACVIESAAKAHPTRQIYVLFSSPVNEKMLLSSNLATLRLKGNIHFRRVHLEEYAKKSHLRRLVSRNVVYQSKWWIENSVHLLKILTLFKYGGIYLDTDVLVARSLSPLGNNWIGMYDSMNINTAILAISKNQHGRKFIKSILNIHCHYLEEEDALPSAEDVQFTPGPDLIFFHETSCRGSLTPRQACVIESAATNNPEREIYVLFSAPVSELMLTSGNLKLLQSLANIKYARVHLTRYAKNTPLEEMVNNKPFEASKWWIEHTSDVLRTLSLFKWGGIYLDTDMLIAKTLTPLGPNWVAKEDNNLVNSAAIAISTDAIGRRLADALLEELKTTYRPDVWIHNGPGAITRVLSRVCKTHKAKEWSSSDCDGIEVYSPAYFYPVNYNHCKVYFEPGELNSLAKNAYGYHFWNKLTHNMKIQKDSPLMKLAEQFCPTIFNMYGDSFGDI